MNDDYHKLMIAARRELDPERRAVLYRQAQEIVFEECPMVPLAHAEQLMACRANVDGVLFEVNGDILFRNATVK
jgi:ABC-type transport system substrate-binding protein